MNWAELERDLVSSLGPEMRILQRSPLRGGDTSQTWRLSCAGKDCFLKLEPDSRAGRLHAEAAGLVLLAQTGAVHTPAVLRMAGVAGYGYLLLDHLELQALDSRSATTLGTCLAQLHRAPTEGTFGGVADNFIGASTQPNTSYSDWTAFFAEQRLAHQLRLAAGRAASRELLDTVQRVIDELPVLLQGHRPRPSLLHGDLWSGNAAALADGTPVIFDPAVYVGDREADLAMTELFGGFPLAFYAAYQEAWPLDGGYALRRDLYNLYHVLNHYNIFGGGYGAQAVSLSRRLLCEVR